MRPLPPIVVVVALGLTGVAAWQVWWQTNAPPGGHPPNDFPEYWSAAKVAIAGGDPYDADQLLPWQRAAAGDPALAIPVMMWNPPWALALVLPLGWLGAGPAAVAWSAVQVAAVLLAVHMLWAVYRGPPGVAWLPTALGLTFYATLVNLRLGQIGGLLVLGPAGFVYYVHRGAPLRAGAFAALTAVKPHLFVVFAVWLLLEATRRDGRRVVLAGGVALAAAVGATAVARPGVVADYLAALGRPVSQSHVPLQAFDVPTLGYWLRATHGGGRFWVQFVPAGVIAAAAVGYWLARRRAWDWAAELPAAVWLSSAAAPYGLWAPDHTTLLVPATQAAAWVARSGRPIMWWAFGLAFVAVMGEAVTGHYPVDQFNSTAGVTFVWWAAAWLLAGRRLPNAPVDPPGGPRSLP